MRLAPTLPSLHLTAIVLSTALFLAVALSGCSRIASVGEPQDHAKILAASSAEQQHRARLIDDLVKLMPTTTKLRSGTLRAALASAVEDSCLHAIDAEQIRDEQTAVAKAALDLKDARSRATAFSGKFSFPRHPTNSSRTTWCGGNGCAGSCAAQCSLEDVCHDDLCSCVPKCGDKQCGDDGCGGVCGASAGGCASGEVCDAQSQCVPQRTIDRACEPACDRGGKAKHTAMKLADGKQRDYTPSRRTRRASRTTFQTRETLEAYITVLAARADALGRRLTTHTALTHRIVTLKAAAIDTSAAATQAKTARAAQAATVKTALARLAGVVKAATDPTAQAAANAVTVTAKQEAATAQALLAASVQNETAANTAATTASKTLKDALAEHKRDDPGMQRVATAKARVDAEHKRTTAYGAQWRSAEDAVAMAERAHKSAETALALAVKAQEDNVALAKRRATVVAARLAAADLLLTRGERRALTCTGIQCPVGAHLWGLDADLVGLTTIADKLQQRADAVAVLVGSVATDVAVPTVANGTGDDSYADRFGAALTKVQNAHPGCLKNMDDAVLKARIDALLPVAVQLRRDELRASARRMKDTALLLRNLHASNARLLSLRVAAAHARAELSEL